MDHIIIPIQNRHTKIDLSTGLKHHTEAEIDEILLNLQEKREQP